MKHGILTLSFVSAALLLSCSRAVEPGLYRIHTDTEDGFVRAYTDSLGKPAFLLYGDRGGVWADTLQVSIRSEKRKFWISFPDGREEKALLEPYEELEFQHFPVHDLYLDPLYAVGETKDIVYGRVIRSHSADRSGEDLTLDLYRPLNDRGDSRPLLMVFHGGAFQRGDKRDSSIVEWCRHFASLGYVVSSVNYRLGYQRNVEDTDAALYRSLKDAHAAVRFLLKRDSLLIHSERIFAAGTDAGAITALNLAFMRDENLPEIIHDETDEGDSVQVARPTLLRGFDIRAVANLWGAVPDSALLYNAKIPVISFQSRNDPTVPFGAGFPYEEPEDEENTLSLRSIFESILSIFLPDVHPFREMYGAGVIDRVLKKQGTVSELYAYEEPRHDLFWKADGSFDYLMFDEATEKTARFFSTKMETSPVSLRQDPEDLQVFVINDAEVNTCYWKVEGGAVISKSSNTIRILFFPDAPIHSVSVSGLYTTGLAFYETVAL